MEDQNRTKALERENLLLLTRLVIRGLLEHCMQSKNRLLTAESSQLLDLFVMVEKVFRHGFKSARNLIGFRTPEQDMWMMFERIGRMSKDAEETVSCVQQLPNIHSPICRVRAWLRLAAMQKKLADYFQLIVDTKPLLRDYYEEWALLRNDTTGVVFSGSLIGLRVIDCNLCLKEEDLTQQTFNVDLSSYIKIPTVPLGEENEESAGISEEANREIKSILDQKNYLEERNRQLIANMANMQRRLAILENMRRHGRNNPSFDLSENGSPDLNKEPDAFWEDSVDMLPLTKVEELETAMTLLEKDVHEKQDTIVSLRQQIDDVKKINLDLYQKLRAYEDSSKQKDKLIGNLEKEVEKDRSSWNNKVNGLQIRVDELDISRNKSLEVCKNLELELKRKTEYCAELQKNLAESLEEKKMLEESRSAERMAREDLETRLNTLQNAEKELFELQGSHEIAQRKVSEYEKTLEELGIHLSQSKLKVEDLKEGMFPLAEAQWESDKEAVSCKQCEEKFSVSRRKHHCRNCGGIYCSTCSENTMPLPSSAKPVRVCDGCYEMLLKRYSAKGYDDS